MAKVRVYELAKELEMKPIPLLEKIRKMGFEVKSHMSSLDDDVVLTVRKNILGRKGTDKNQDKAKKIIIRRRRGSSPKNQESQSDQAQEESANNQSAEPVEQSSASENTAADNSEKTEISDQKPTPANTLPRKTTEKKKAETDSAAKSKKVPEKTSEPAAKIIKPAPRVFAKETSSDKKQALSDMPKPAEKQKTEPEETLKEPLAEETNASRKLSEEPLVSKSRGKTKTKTDEEKTDSEPSAPVEKKKPSASGAAPAKIVKLADPIALENIQKNKSSEDNRSSSVRKSLPKSAPADLFAKGMAAPDFDKESDPFYRQKDKRKNAPGDREEFGKRKKRKRKSIVEKSDLYDRSPKKRGKKDNRKKTNFQKTQITVPKAIKRRIKIDEAIELAELAKRMGIKANEMIAKLMSLGVMATVNQTIDFDTAALVASEFHFEVEKANFEEEDLLQAIEKKDDQAKMISRAPVVTIMGHVDHGKTSLLDVIRESKTNIVAGEAGGITQHIGAYNVETANGGRITFLDTPGHAAFTAMRSRGAQVTDVVILVVAADDGVMPQTIEAINHSRDANVPVVVAVNKMDKPGADPDRIMRELSEQGLLAEDWGGDVIFVKVSAKTGQGIDELLEMVLLQSEVLELKANPDRNASGYVVESRLDTGRGPVATVLVNQGTLKDGDAVVCGLHSGRVRAMIDDDGNRIDSAGPSTPVEIIGLSGVPDAGDEFIALDSDKDAKQIANHRMQKQRAKELAKKSRANLEKMFENLGTAEVKELKLIVKADVQGSIEALNDSLKDLAKEEVDVKIVHSATGTINESDVALAGVSDAIIIGFNVRPSQQIRKLARDENVDMRFYDVIFEVINDIKTALEGLMPSTFEEIIIGQAQVRETFVVPRVGTIAGCYITDGKVIRGKNVRLLRDGVIKCDTQLSSLRRFKDDVKEVDQGFECGIGLEKFNDIKPDDVIECYEVEEKKYNG